MKQIENINTDLILEQLCGRYPSLIPLKNSIARAAEMIIKCYSGGGKIMVCGNGGSSSDSDHMVGELMKSFELKIPIKTGLAEKLSFVSEERGKYLAEKLENGFSAISLSAQTALTSAICNDIGADLVFAQQVSGYARDGDVLVAISTSGNSQSIIDACITAKALNINVIGLTGLKGGRMRPFCDILLNVPETRTVYAQELHLPVLHAICLLIEKHFYGNK